MRLFQFMHDNEIVTRNYLEIFCFYTEREWIFFHSRSSAEWQQMQEDLCSLLALHLIFYLVEAAHLYHSQFLMFNSDSKGFLSSTELKKPFESDSKCLQGTKKEPSNENYKQTRTNDQRHFFKFQFASASMEQQHYLQQFSG